MSEHVAYSAKFLGIKRQTRMPTVVLFSWKFTKLMNIQLVPIIRRNKSTKHDAINRCLKTLHRVWCDVIKMCSASRLQTFCPISFSFSRIANTMVWRSQVSIPVIRSDIWLQIQMQMSRIFPAVDLLHVHSFVSSDDANGMCELSWTHTHTIKQQLVLGSVLLWCINQGIHTSSFFVCVLARLEMCKHTYQKLVFNKLKECFNRKSGRQNDFLFTSRFPCRWRFISGESTIDLALNAYKCKSLKLL